MPSSNALKRPFTSILVEGLEFYSIRRGLLIAPSLAKLALAICASTAQSREINRAETSIMLADGESDA